MNQDQEHLRLLSIFHHVMAGFACLLPLLSLVYIGMGAVIVNGKLHSSPSAAAHADLVGGWVFVAVGSAFFLVGCLGATLNFLVGRSLARRERRTLCLVVAGLNCLHMPFGTLLGVFTLIVMSRPSVKVLFEASLGDAGRAALSGYAPGTSPFSRPNL